MLYLLLLAQPAVISASGETALMARTKMMPTPMFEKTRVSENGIGANAITNGAIAM